MEMTWSLKSIYDSFGCPEHERDKERLAELAAMVGIDVRDRRFWDSSLALIKEDIRRFCEY